MTLAGFKFNLLRFRIEAFKLNCSFLLCFIPQIDNALAIKEKKYNILDIFTSCNVFFVTLLCALLWYVYYKSFQFFLHNLWSGVALIIAHIAVCGSECLYRIIINISYYALILNTSNLHGDPYLNCFFSALTEVPAYIIALILLQYCSRHLCQSSTLFLGGAMIFCVHLIPIGKSPK